MGTYNDEPDLLTKFKQLESRMERLERSTKVGNTSLEEGDFIVKGGRVITQGGSIEAQAADGSVVLARFGVMPDGTQGWQLWRGDNTKAAESVAHLVYGQPAEIWSWFDAEGGTLVTEDQFTGNALARPYIPFVLGESYYQQWPGTVNASFETIWQSQVYRVCPKFLALMGSTSSASGTVGEMRMLVNGVQIGSTVAIGWGYGYDWMGGPIDAGNHEMVSVEIQARRTAGTANIHAGFLAGWQVQS